MSIPRKHFVSTTCIALLLALSSLAPAQTDKLSSGFLHKVDVLSGYPFGNDKSTTRDRLRNELGFTDEDSESIFTAARDQQSESLAIDKALRAIVRERRLAILAGDPVSTPPESELIALTARKKEERAQLQFEGLKTKLGEAKFEAFRAYVESGKYKAWIPSKVGVASFNGVPLK